ADTTTSESVSASLLGPGQAVTFTAWVARATAGYGAPTGSVTFVNAPIFGGWTTLGTATISSGVASLTLTTGLTPGYKNIVAEYDGDANFNTSNSLTENVD